MQKVLLSGLPQYANDVLAKLAVKNTAAILALSGELGAGKTTFVQALGKALGISETMQSPTYVLMKKYQIPQGDTLTPGLSKVSPFKQLIHIDAYRLEKPEEFAALRPEQFLQDPKTLVVVEWPEKAAGALPLADVTINFSSQDVGEEERYIEVI